MTLDASTFEAFELHGRWWTPENPDDSIGGVLSYDPEDGIRLKLSGAFEAEDELFRFNPDVIIGNTDEGPTTVHNCHFSSGKGPGFPPEDTFIERIYLATDLFVGHKFESYEDLTFSSMAFAFSNFEEWIDADPFEHEYGREHDDFDERVTWRFPEPTEFRVDEIEANIRLDHLFGGAGFPTYREMTWTRRAMLFIEPDAPKHLDFFDTARFRLQTMIAAMTGQAVYTTYSYVPAEVENGQEIRGRTEHYRPPRRGKPPKATDSIGMWYHLGREGPGLADCIQSWFTASEWADEAMKLFSGVQRRRDMFVNNRLLLLTQALESFHRSKVGGDYMPQDEYEEKVEPVLKAAIPEVVDDDHRASLGSAIHYGYQFSLRKRLKDLMGGLPDNLQRTINEEPMAFLDSIVETRNYYTHYDDQGKHLEFEELVRALPSLETFLRILLLKEAGVPDVRIREGAEKARQFGA